MQTHTRWATPRIVPKIDPDRRLREFGARVAKRRRDTGLGSQRNAAGALGVRHATWAEWETGKKWPTVENAIALSRLLRLTLDELILGRSC